MGKRLDNILPPFLNKKKDIASKTVVNYDSILIGNSFVPKELVKQFLNRPEWVAVENLYNIYITNPILFAAISINAKYFSSVEVKVRNIKTGEIYSKQDMRENKITDPIAKKMFKLIAEPNPLESTSEFLTFNSITHDIFGNSQIRGNFPFNRYNINEVQTLYGLWPQFMIPKLTGMYLNATTINEIIEKWDYNLTIGSGINHFEPEEILHRKEPNATYLNNTDIVLGISRIVPLQKPLSNITLAYEARNVIAKERGISVVISSEQKDAQMGSLPLEPDDQKRVEEAFREKWGTREGQNRFYFSPISLKVDQIDQDIRKLGILEEIAMDAMIIAHIYNVPIELIKMFLQGATYENQGASDRRMYQTNTIPKANDFFEDLNNWLLCRDFGFEYYPSFDHIAVLQADKKETSLVRRNESFVCREAFLAGTITGNEWRLRMGFEKSKNKWFDLYIWEMTDAQVNLITGRNTMMAQNENKPPVNSSSQL